MADALVRRGCEVVGVEFSPELAEQARTRLDHVIESDVEELATRGVDPGGPFDCVVMADVLEHLRNPWQVVRWASGLVGEGGSMVISIPNIRHAQLLWSVVLRRRWPYREVGIFDRTHLRWFAYENIDELLDSTGFKVAELHRSYWLTTNNSRVNRWARRFGDFGTFQFIFRAERVASPR